MLKRYPAIGPNFPLDIRPELRPDKVSGPSLIKTQNTSISGFAVNGTIYAIDFFEWHYKLIIRLTDFYKLDVF